jgi:3-oxoacyl-[acyl-carrier-protein] synthase I
MNREVMSTNRQGISIIGVGARTPLGLNAASSAAAVRAGISAMHEHPSMIDRYGDPMIVTADVELTLEVSGVDRYISLALTAAIEALAPLRRSICGASFPVNVLIALPEDRPGNPHNLANSFIQGFGARLEKEIKIQEITCNSKGNAGGLACFENALSLIENGKSEFCLVGGVDSYQEPEILQWLDSLEQLHSENTIWGFCPGEGAGFCLLTSHMLADRLNLNTLIDLQSASWAMESNCIKMETVCIGEGLSETFKKTLSGLPQGCRISHTICDMNGEPYRANEYGFSLLRTASRFEEDAGFQTPADCWGDMGAASGPLFAMLAAFSSKNGYAMGPLTFLWASSEGGMRASALLNKHKFIKGVY